MERDRSKISFSYRFTFYMELVSAKYYPQRHELEKKLLDFENKELEKSMSDGSS